MTFRNEIDIFTEVDYGSNSTTPKEPAKNIFTSSSDNRILAQCTSVGNFDDIELAGQTNPGIGLRSIARESAGTPTLPVEGLQQLDQAIEAHSAATAKFNSTHQAKEQAKKRLREENERLRNECEELAISLNKKVDAKVTPGLGEDTLLKVKRHCNKFAKANEKAEAISPTDQLIQQHTALDRQIALAEATEKAQILALRERANSVKLALEQEAPYSKQHEEAVAIDAKLSSEQRSRIASQPVAGLLSTALLTSAFSAHAKEFQSTQAQVAALTTKVKESDDRNAKLTEKLSDALDELSKQHEANELYCNAFDKSMKKVDTRFRPSS